METSHREQIRTMNYEDALLCTDLFPMVQSWGLHPSVGRVTARGDGGVGEGWCNILHLLVILTLYLPSTTRATSNTERPFGTESGLL